MFGLFLVIFCSVFIGYLIGYGVGHNSWFRICEEKIRKINKMSAFGNDVKDEVYNAIKELFANGYKISDLLEIVKYAIESKECEEGD